MLVAALTMTLQGAIVKDLGATIDSIEIAFFRGLFGVLLVLPFVLRRLRLRDLSRRAGLHAGRAIAGVGSLICTFYAFTAMPLADATTIMFTMPMFLIVLAVPFLGESVGWRRTTATLIGFLGVVIVVRPGTTTFDPASLVALLGALLHAVVGVFVKKLARVEPTELIMLYFSLLAMVVFLVPMLYVWHTPTPVELALLGGVAVLGVANQVFFIAACRVGEMTVVAPLDYTRLLFAGVLGYVAFGEIPDEMAILGALIIVASGFFILRRSAAVRRAEKLADASEAVDPERRDIYRRRPAGDEVGDDPSGH
jgi:drug/metabolite transporter (DMT)-like permease